MMNKEWKESKVNDVANVVDFVANGSFASLKENVQYLTTPDYAVLLRLADFNGGWNKNYVYVSESSYRFLRKSTIETGDVIIPNVGANAGDASSIFQAPNLGIPMTLGPNAVKVSPKVGQPLDKNFFYYYLIGPQGQHKLKSIIAGSAQPKFNKTDFRNLNITLPPLREQRAIASVLGSLDEQIELLRRQNATLERLAQTLFRAWFVEFEPVKAKAAGIAPVGLDAATAALFPAEFEDEGLNAGLPKGWQHANLGDICSYRTKKVHPSSVDNSTPYIGLEHMPQNSIALGEWSEASNADSTKSCFESGDILFGKLRPYFHKVGVAPVAGICSTDILVVQASELNFGQALCYLSSDDFIAYVSRLADGARMPRVGAKDVAAYPVVMPTDEIKSAFSTIVAGFTSHIENNLRQARTLGAMRDQLLPRLISGALRVPESLMIDDES